ncbi:MAG: hypothetical protein RLZZ584_275 [Pseudomonadota bacterium]
MPESRAARPARRRLAWWATLATVLGLHLWLAERLAATLIEFDDASRPGLQRMHASYTRVLAPAPPPVAAAGTVTPATARSAGSSAAASARPAGPASTAQDAAVPPQESASAAAGEVVADRDQDQRGNTGVDSDATRAAFQASAGSAAVDGVPAEPGVPASAPVDTGAPARPGASAAAAAGAGAALSAAAGQPSAAAPRPASSAVAAASAAASAVAATTGVELLDGVAWPASTRLRYRLNGWYRGEVQGSAQVEWLRQGRRYQVHLEVSIGPSFAPLVTRRMSSEGRIVPDGLWPQRYEQETAQIIGRTRRADMVFAPESVHLATGQNLPRPPDVQDTASQFVQMVFLLTRRPELARPGAVVEFALALPHRIDRWTYDMVGLETLATPVGAVETVHVRPRQRASGSDMTVQMWLAPSLQMLPARIRIEQTDEVWADLLLLQAPEQAAR